MKLLNFSTSENDHQRLGVRMDGTVIDVTAAARALKKDTVPTSVDAVLQEGAPALAPLRDLAHELAQEDTAAWQVGEADIQYGPCVTRPEKIICIGLNYTRHAEESGAALPEVPILFSKFNNALAGAHEAVPLLDNAVEYDYEVELGAVIGKEARAVSVPNALDHVLGYCTVNDLSVRDLQMRTSQWLLGKTLDKFMPVGPYLVTADEVDDPQDLALRCWVNGDLRQDSSTADMIFSVAECISYISQYMTLKPGDLISTGTPEGVVLGRAEKDWLQPGDEVTVEIENLGRLTNPLVSADVPAAGSA